MSLLLNIGVQSIIASLIRLWLFTSEFKKEIGERVEISTPLNSWKRVTEGVHLLNVNGDPYAGDLIHEPPLHLLVYKHLIYYLHDYLPCLFILCDLITAVLLFLTARKYLSLTHKQQNAHLSELDASSKNRKEAGDSVKSSNKHFLNETHVQWCPSYVFAAYAFNPFVIFNCVAMTTTVFNNLFLALYICTLVHRRMFLSCISLAVSTMHTMYPIILISPILLNLKYEKRIKTKIIMYSLTFIVVLIALHYLSCFISGNWKFVENTYGFILLIPDLQPNIGLFWYFFTEMFEHFRALFIASFQINVMFLYLIPLSIRFRKDPILLATSLIVLSTIFKSYPSIGEVGLCLSLIPMWMHLFPYLQQEFLVSCCFLITTILAPVVWHLWIYSRSANANFYFGVTLSFATAQIFLITDLLFAYIKTEFWLKNHHIDDTENAKLTLK